MMHALNVWRTLSADRGGNPLEFRQQQRSGRTRSHFRPTFRSAVVCLSAKSSPLSLGFQICTYTKVVFSITQQQC